MQAHVMLFGHTKAACIMLIRQHSCGKTSNTKLMVHTNLKCPKEGVTKRIKPPTQRLVQAKEAITRGGERPAAKLGALSV